MKKCWVDISNGPHVHFFQFIEHFEENVLFTARNYSPIPELLDLHDIPAKKIGFHGGCDLYDKLISSTERILILAEYIRNKGVDLLINKHSIESSRVAWGLGIPSISYIDNEVMGPQGTLICSLADVLIAPLAIDQYTLRKFTPGHVNILQYNGVSEVANVYNCKPDENVLNQLNLKTNHPIIVIRGEPTLASYAHGKKSIVELLIEKIKTDVPDAQIVRFNRVGDKNNSSTPNIDARSLFSYADIVISGGGTMTREAALLGSNAISFFEKPLAVDRYLIDNNLLQSFPGKKILDVNFKEQIARKLQNPDLNHFEHPFELLDKAEDLIRLKKPLPYDYDFNFNTIPLHYKKKYFRKNAKINGFCLGSEAIPPQKLSFRKPE